MQERRQEDRQRTLKSGKIVFNDKRSVIDCLIRNLSDNGACLQVNSANGFPKCFELQIDSIEHSRPCRIVWETDTRLGIEFIEAHQKKPLSDAIEASTHTISAEDNRATLTLAIILMNDLAATAICSE
jgi:hypothetical protein